MARSDNTIVLKGPLGRHYDEARASVKCLPGHILELDSAGKVKPHTVRGGRTQRYVCIEDGMRGMTIDGGDQANAAGTGYPIDDVVRFERVDVGDWTNLLLKAGQVSAVGGWAVSNGDGTVTPATGQYLLSNTGDSTTVTNTTVETTFSNGTYTIPANALQAGDLIRVRGFVVFPATNGTDTAAVNVKIGATTVLAIPALDVANNDVFFFDVTVKVRTVGAAGTITAFSQYSQGALGTATTRTQTLNSTAIDTTTNQAVTVTVTWSVANAGDQAILRDLVIERVPAAAGAAGGTLAGGQEPVGTFREALDLSLSATNGFVAVEWH